MEEQKNSAPNTHQANIFRNNSEYMAWELAWIQQRARAFIAARKEGKVSEFMQLVELHKTERIGAIRRRRRSWDVGIPLSAELLSRRFNLTPAEEDLVYIAMAPHMSANTRQLLLYAQGDDSKPYLTLGFIADLVHPSPDTLTFRAWGNANSRLVERGLILVKSIGATSNLSRLGHMAQTPHYIAAAILGEMTVDEQLNGYATLEEASTDLFDVVLNPETARQVECFIESSHSRGLNSLLASWTVLITGEKQTGKTLLAKAIAKIRKEPIFSLSCHKMEANEASIDLLELAYNNALFFNSVLHIVRPEACCAHPQLLSRLQQIVQRYPKMVVIETINVDEFYEALRVYIDFTIDMYRPTTHIREQLWESLIPHQATIEGELKLAELGAHYDLTGGQIRTAIDLATKRARARGDDGALRHEDLVVGARAQLRSNLRDYAQLSRIDFSMDDLILCEETMETVETLMYACRNRDRIMTEWGFGRRLITGKGLVSLFFGEAGTGKTFCAEILANELGLQLYMVHIPNIVSKWVGETEKHIREVFSQARAQNSMLLFDEADALFSKRVKVSSSQDHYLNMEVNQLLVEIERFDGIVILTTNMERNIDPAFQRRILYKIEFGVPEEEERAKIWKLLVPKETPQEDIDFEKLGKQFVLTGGEIKNVIMKAAYKCMQDNAVLSFDALAKVAVVESAITGRLVREPNVKTRPLPVVSI